MSNHDDIRSSVSATYARAVTQGPSGGCGCDAPVEPGLVVTLGGYTGEQLGALPADAVSNAFGCGNPVAVSGIGEGQVVVDLGSGAGIDVLLAARKTGPTGRVIGIDMTDAMIAKARANIAAAGLAHAEIRKGIIEALPVDGASVDWVISNCVINLSPDKPRAFAEIARVLKPGGRMMVSDIVAQEMPAALRGDQALYASCLSGAVSEEDYLAGLERAGLVDVRVLDRLVYDADQLEAFFCGGPDGASCCGTPGSPGLVPQARALAGKVWSARVSARKPG